MFQLGFSIYFRTRFCAGITSLIAVALLSACALNKPPTRVVKDCVLPQDQAATLIAHWRVTAVPIAVHSGDFNAQEVAIIASAADTWNQFYAASLGMAAIDTGGGGTVRQSAAAKPASWCSQAILGGTSNSYSGNVMIYKNGTWPSANSQVIAWTHQCPVPAKPMPLMMNAIMEINYQNFFIAGRKIPDLKSIVIHELGHVMGLDHSCEPGSTRTGMPDCRSASVPSDYLSANMFPTFAFDGSGYGETRQALNDNDQGRANCLYSSGVTTN